MAIGMAPGARGARTQFELTHKNAKRSRPDFTVSRMFDLGTPVYSGEKDGNGALIVAGVLQMDP